MVPGGLGRPYPGAPRQNKMALTHALPGGSKKRGSNEAQSQAGFAPPGAADTVEEAAPPRFVWDPPEPLFSEARIRAKGVYGRARPNFHFWQSTLLEWRLAHAREVLAALLAAGGVLAALEWLVYGARALPRAPTIAILAPVEWTLFVLGAAAIGLMLLQFACNKWEEFVPS